MSLVEKIKALFNEANPTSEATSFVDVKSQDGTLLLRISELAVDGTVEVINEDGTLSPYAGEVVLEDGTEISVVEGRIAEIATKEAEASEGEPEGEMSSEKPAEVITETKTEEVLETVEAAESPAKGAEDIASNLEGRIDALEKRISEIIDMLKGKEAEMKDKVETMSAENAELKAKNEELAKRAAAPAVEFKKIEKAETATSKKNLSLVEKLALLKEENNK